ncbi:unnamed protein product [Heligmosomoides polygyrus]|uniref:Uncharacterized protein n=1 Tax=Heligmosomoides polygyrus TaxID=6339 RepID=A0A183G888_HELPZ|nr:unnamed protein product [Heligmosomoides polygyrus]
MMQARKIKYAIIGEKAAKFKKRNPRTSINWDLYASLAGPSEDAVMDNVDEEYDRFSCTISTIVLREPRA